MKKLISFALSSIIGLTGVTAINLLNPTPVLAQWGRNHYASMNGGKVYTVDSNQHGLVIGTSVGTFYIGKSGDAIRQVNKQRYYGSWRKNYIGEDGLMLYVNIGNRTYTFDLYAEYGEYF